MDATCPCDNTIQSYLITNDEQVYLLNSSKLVKPNTNYTKIEMVKQIPNIECVQLIASHVDDSSADAVDLLRDIFNEMTEMVLTMLTVTGTDVVTFDPDIIKNAAVQTISMIKSTDVKTLANFHSIVKWINIIIITSIAILVIFIITKICRYRDRKKTNKIINRMIDISKKRTTSIANKNDTTAVFTNINLRHLILASCEITLVQLF